MRNRPIRAPFFEIGPKAYVYGEDVFILAKHADHLSAKYGVDIIFTAPYAEIYRIVQETEHIYAFAPHMDPIRPGRGITKILPEELKAIGASGVMLNHAEHPLTYKTLQETVRRAKELGLMTAICADSVAEAKAVAQLGPTLIVAEPSELIGTGKISDLSYITESTEAIKRVDPSILVLQAAGVKTSEDVFRNIYAGADASGTTSGIVKAEQPLEVMEQMICAVREAYDKRQKDMKKEEQR